MPKQIVSPRKRFSSFVSVAIAFLMVGVISFLGVKTYQDSHAATGGALYLNPSTSSLTAGSNVSVSVRENSGSEAVNSVQAALNYDANMLQYVGITEGGVFSIVAANSTSTPGLIRIGRGTDTPRTGDQAVVTLTFKVLGAGTANLTLDKAYSFLVRSSDSNDILQSLGTASYDVAAGAVSSGNKPVMYVSPPSGSIAAGATLSAQIRVNAFSTPVSTVEPVVSYPADKLEYLSTAESGVFSTRQRTKDSKGTIDIIRGVSGGNSGIAGDNPVVTLNFKVLASSGTASLSIASASGVFDGNGANILDVTGSADGTYNLVAAGTETPPLQSATQNGGTVEKAETLISQSQSFKVRTSKTGNASLSKDASGNDVTEVSGEVELAPVATSSSKDPSAGITKVEYYLNNKLVSTQSSDPYTYKVKTTSLKNGTYSVGVKTYFTDGTVNTSSDKMLVKNKITLAYLLKHYLPPILIGLAIVAGIFLLTWKVILPKLLAKHDASKARAVAQAEGSMYGFVDPTGAQTLVAADPTLVAPSTGVVNTGSIASGYTVPSITEPAAAAEPLLQRTDMVIPTESQPPTQVPVPQPLAELSAVPVPEPLTAAEPVTSAAEPAAVYTPQASPETVALLTQHPDPEVTAPAPAQSIPTDIPLPEPALAPSDSVPSPAQASYQQITSPNSANGIHGGPMLSARPTTASDQPVAPPQSQAS